MISKELLSEVLNKTVGVVYTEDSQGNSFTNFVRPRFGDFVDEINIYELAHKCKEWAHINNRELYSSYKGHCYISNLNVNNPDNIIDHYGDSEPEAIFKACQWILDNKDSHD